MKVKIAAVSKFMAVPHSAEAKSASKEITGDNMKRLLLVILVIGVMLTGCYDESVATSKQVKELLQPTKTWVEGIATKVGEMDTKMNYIMQQINEIRAQQDAILQNLEAIKHSVSYGQAVPPVNITINGSVNGQGEFTATLHSFDEAVDYINSYRYTTPR